MSQKPEDHFIREYTKAKPLSKRRLAIRGLLILLAGFIFGLGFAGGQILLAHMDDGDGIYRESSDPTETQTQEPQIEEPQEPQEPVAEPLNTDEEDLSQITLEEYQSVKYELYQIGRRANHSIVTVTGTARATDMLNLDYEDANQSLGIILSNDGEKLLILTGYEALKGERTIQVEFENGDVQSAELVGYHDVLSMAIVSVKVEDLQPQTLNEITVATLNTDGIVAQGQLVVAVGRPLGSMYSILDGSITMVSDKIVLEDGNYLCYGTTMAGNASTGSILINTSGEIIGIVNRVCEQNSSMTLSALSAKDLSDVVDQMMEGKKTAYLGVTMQTVTDEVANTYQLPSGVYVSMVTTDSPAMRAGLQSGDIITSIDGEELLSAEDLRSVLLTKQPEQVVELQVMRGSGENYSEMTIAVTLD
ncbi:MAG: S1C family serine protease [Eubacteriales bacterium]|nr:S1C family serine protease [Eubacteriales bacterium]